MHGHLEIPGPVETEEESFRSRDQRTYFLLRPYLTISTAGLGHQELPGCFAFVGAPLNSSASLPILVPFKTWNDSGGVFFPVAPQQPICVFERGPKSYLLGSPPFTTVLSLP